MPPAAKLLAAFMAMSLFAWGIIARVHFIPWLDRRTKREALLIVVMPHMFRHVGSMAMFPGIADLPDEWRIPLAWGDGITAVLAALSMIALHKSWSHATKLVWVFNVFGILDLLHNGYNAAALQLAPRLGVIAYVVGFGVPMMLMFHILVFRTLLVARVSAPDPLP
jgi:hypothetical protein